MVSTCSAGVVEFTPATGVLRINSSFLVPVNLYGRLHAVITVMLQARTGLSVLNLWIREMPTILLSERWLMLPVQLKALVTERRIRIQLHIKHGAWRTRILLQRTIICPLELEIPG